MQSSAIAYKWLRKCQRESWFVTFPQNKSKISGVVCPEGFLACCWINVWYATLFPASLRWNRQTDTFLKTTLKIPSDIWLICMLVKLWSQSQCSRGPCSLPSAIISPPRKGRCWCMWHFCQSTVYTKRTICVVKDLSWQIYHGPWSAFSVPTWSITSTNHIKCLKSVWIVLVKFHTWETSNTCPWLEMLGCVKGRFQQVYTH